MSNSKNALRGALGCLTAMSLVLSLPGIAAAQVAAGQTQPTQPAAPDPNGGTLGSLAPIVFLAEDTARCKAKTKEEMEDCPKPRAARPSTISSDTPYYTQAQYVTRYPNSGIQGYMRIALDNKELCVYMNGYLMGITSLDQIFVATGNEYEVLQSVYESLPDDVKRATHVAYVGQGASAVAGCVLSFGLYCIMAVGNAIGNVAVLRANLKLQLANIELSLANIGVTKANIYSNRITLRLDAWWIVWYGRGCQKLGYTLVATLPELPPVPTLPNFNIR